MSEAGGPLVLIGDSLFAEIAHEYFEHDSPYEVVAFSVEREYRKRERFRGLDVIPFEDLAQVVEPATTSAHAAITYGRMNRTRRRLAAAASAKGFALASYVSSRAFVWHNVEIGEHCFIFEDNTIQPFVRIGCDNVMWSGNHIGHHSTIGDGVFVASHAVISGSVRIGDNSFVGVNATIVNDVEVGADCWIGPHVVVTRDLPPDTVWRPAPGSQREGSARKLFRADG